MPHHYRSRSRSHSVFSIDTLRVLSRAGSRQACRGVTELKENARPISSLSNTCTVHDRPQATLHTSDNYRDSYPPYRNGRNTPKFGNTIQKAKSRLSWFPFTSQTLAARSIIMPDIKDDQAAIMDRSGISAPVLTSTTNTNVTITVPDECKEHSTQLPGGGRRPAPFNALDRSESEVTDTEVQPTAFARFGALIKSKLRPWQKIQVIASNPIQEEPESASFLKQQVQRCHAETMNLCNSKARNLTGNGNVKRKNLNSYKISGTSGDCEESARSSEESLLKDTPIHRFVDFSSGDWDKEQPSGSLSRSFHSALEKLDNFDHSSSVSTGLLRSLVSRTNLSRVLGDKSNTTNSPTIEASTGRHSSRSRNSPEPSSCAATLRDLRSSNEDCSDPGNRSATTDDQQGSRTISAMAENRAAFPAKAAIPKGGELLTTAKQPKFSGIETSDPKHQTFTKDGYILTKPHSGYPRGVNPLRMHMNSMILCTPPSEKQPRHKSYKEEFKYWRDLPVDAHGRPLQPQSLVELEGPLATKTPHPYAFGPSTLMTLAQPRNPARHPNEGQAEKPYLANNGNQKSGGWVKVDHAMAPLIKEQGTQRQDNLKNVKKSRSTKGLKPAGLASRKMPISP